MTGYSYSFEPTEGYHEYKVTSVLKDYLNLLVAQTDNKEYIEHILSQIRNYTTQLNNLQLQNRLDTIREVYKAIDGYFNAAPDESKKDIQCSEGCTACCFIDIDVSYNEAALIIDYCKSNDILIDKKYLEEQAIVGRQVYSTLSKCVFLVNNLCSVYAVRPVACRKHWVKTDPLLCDFSKNIANPVGKYFDINIEILASALLNADKCESLQNALLHEIDNC